MSWQVQLRERPTLRPRAHVYDLDGLRAKASLVARIEERGSKAVCYVNAGVWERRRNDADRFPRRLLGARAFRAGERWLDVRSRALRPLIGARLEKCARKGFDGVHAGNVDGYRYRTGFPLSSSDQLVYNRWLANRAHRLGLSVALEDDLPQARALAPWFDFAIVQECVRSASCGRLAPFLDAGKAVFDIEYRLDPADFCAPARARGITAIEKRRALDAWRRACAPTVRIISGPRDPSSASDASFELQPSPDAWGLQCSLDGQDFAPCSSPVTLASLADGSHLFVARAYGGVPRKLGRPARFAWTVDTTAPTALLEEAPPDPASDTRATFAFSSNESRASFECRLDAGAFSPCSSPAAYAVSGPGTHRFAVRAIDRAGNVGAPAVTNWSVADSGRVRPWAMQFVGRKTEPVSRSEAVADATNFDLLMAHFPTYRDHVAAMKDANPALQLYVYLNATFTWRTDLPDSAYSYDADGNRIYPHEWPFTFLLNPRSPDAYRFQVNRAAYVARESGYDGLFADVTGLAPLSLGYVSGLPIDPTTGEPWTPLGWLAAIRPLVIGIKDAVAPRPVIGNGLKSGPAYYDPSAPRDEVIFGPGLVGGVAESWLRHPSDPITRYPTETAWRQNVDMLADIGKRGASVLIQTKAWADGTTAQKDAWYEFALASYLMGNDGRSYFSFTYDKGDFTVPRPWNRLDLGAARGPYAKVDGVYQREFTGGLVLVNPTGGTFTVGLGREYYTLGGDSVSAVTLGPNSAEILTAQPRSG